MTDKLTETVERVTALDIADALDCFWNAAIGAAHERQSSTAMDVASVMAEGIAAISTRLKERAALSRPNVDEMREALVSHLEECAKAAVSSGTDFNQGVVRGLEIATEEVRRHLAALRGSEGRAEHNGVPA